MNFRLSPHRWSSIFSLLILAAFPVQAQNPVDTLQDLVGDKGTHGDAELQQRGYDFLRTVKTSQGTVMYWQETASGKCVKVKVKDGHYQSLVYGTEADCQ